MTSGRSNQEARSVARWRQPAPAAPPSRRPAEQAHEPADHVLKQPGDHASAFRRGAVGPVCGSGPRRASAARPAVAP